MILVIIVFTIRSKDGEVIEKCEGAAYAHPFKNDPDSIDAECRGELKSINTYEPKAFAADKKQHNKSPGYYFHMQASKKKVEDAYQKNAGYYDLAVKVLYPLIGLRINTYRKKAVEYLNLKQGDCVVDLGCGTGLAFPLIMNKIGPGGKLIGVDVSSAMLSVAEDRVNSAQWNNVELIHSDIEQYNIPSGVNGVISTGVFGYLNEREKVLKNISESLVEGARLVIVDGKRPQKWPSFLFKFFIKLSGPYGLTEAYFDNSTPELVSRLFKNITFEDMYGGLLYITSCEKRD